MATISNRLVRYGALAATVPAASANAAIISDTNLDIVLNVGGAQLIDFGPGFGEIFRFELRGANYYFNNPPNYNTNTFTTSYGGYSTTSSTTGGSRGGRLSFNPLFQFNGGSAAGAGFRQNVVVDPLRLASGDPISNAQAFTNLPAGSGTGYDIAQWYSFFRTFSGSTTTSGQFSTGSWNPDSRGFIGFSFLLGGNTHYGWFDVETRSGLSELVIHAWAFNTDPSAPIGAGEIPGPTSGGLLALALGASGVRRSRRKAG